MIIIFNHIDDLVCKVWNVETGQVMTEFQLTSSGMAVSFHPEQKSQVEYISEANLNLCYSY